MLASSRTDLGKATKVGTTTRSPCRFRKKPGNSANYSGSLQAIAVKHIPTTWLSRGVRFVRETPAFSRISAADLPNFSAVETTWRREQNSNFRHLLGYALRSIALVTYRNLWLEASVLEKRSSLG
jgi:hypothetical protein